MINESGQASVVPKKRRGPAPTGIGTSINVRLQPEQLAALDAWIGHQERPCSRPEAIRLLLAGVLHSVSHDRDTRSLADQRTSDDTA